MKKMFFDDWKNKEKMEIFIRVYYANRNHLEETV